MNGKNGSNGGGEGLLERLAPIVKRKRKVLIITHDNPDPDGLASAYALKYLLYAKWRVGSLIAYGGLIGRAENAALIKHLKIEARHISGVNVRDFSVVALVDTQPGTGNNPLSRAVEPEIVIDHHVPIYSRTLRAKFHDIRTDYGSTSSILTEYLMESGVENPDRKVATALFYGIKSDTSDLGREAGPKDMAAHLFLHPHVLFRVLSKISHPRVSVDYVRAFAKALNNALIDGDVIVSDMGFIDNPASSARWRIFCCVSKASNGCSASADSGGASTFLYGRPDGMRMQAWRPGRWSRTSDTGAATTRRQGERPVTIPKKSSVIR